MTDYSPHEPRRASGVTAVLLIGLLLVVVAVAGWMLLLRDRAASVASESRTTIAEAAPLAVASEPSAAPAVDASTRRVVPDPAWVRQQAAATGIPERALTAYAAAGIAIASAQPGCGLGWNTVAAIGAIESAHGSHGGAVLLPSGYTDPMIRGRALDGQGVAAIRDTDGGILDGDADWDRAVGPMQFIPETWARWGADGNGDGRAEPSQIDDAALATARYLCASGPVTTPEGWRAAVFSYNHLESYVDDIARVANQYAAAAG